eukprot:scaffold67359_cov80-Phaeocystis_antarctica.AAC.4
MSPPGSRASSPKRTVGIVHDRPVGSPLAFQQALGECQPRAREGLAGCKADHPLAAGVAGRGHGVAAARKDGTLAVVGVRCAAVHVELKVSAACECGALHCARFAAHRATVQTLAGDSFCGGAHGCAAAAGPDQIASRELVLPRARDGCKADRPLAAGVAGRGHGVAAARKDGTLAVDGVRCAAVHVELKVSAACECGALRCARFAAHRATVQTLAGDSFCGGWLLPGPQAT